MDPAEKLNTEAVENAIAKTLKRNPAMEKWLQEMYETIQRKVARQPTSIPNSKNIAQNSPISAGDNVLIGDSTQTHQTHLGNGDNVGSSKNSSQIGNNSHDNIVIQGLMSEKDISISIDTANKNSHFKNIQSKQDTNIGILLYIKNNVSIEHEIRNIQSGIATDIRINEYFQNSPDYQKLLRHIVLQQIRVSESLTKSDHLHLKEADKLSLFQRHEKEFKSNALRLAEAFLRIEPRTERLQKARALFEQGLILDADKILVEADLMNDQEALIPQMDYLQQRKTQLLDSQKK